MKIRSFNIRPLLFAAVLALGLNSLNLVVLAETDTTFDNDKAACAKNSSRELSTRLNRCVEKVESKEDRHEAIDCNKLESLEERKSCQMNLASQKAGVTSDAGEAASNISNLQSKSSLINTANTIITLISYLSSGLSKNTCTSKRIFGITSTAGMLTDIFLKIKTKNKVKSFQDRYQIDLKDNAYNAQTKALQYLKEEQEMVKDIASLEKKRQMLLLLGYGAATVMAGVETFSNTSCWKPEQASATQPPVSAAPEVKPVDITPTQPTVTYTAAEGTVDMQYQSSPPAPNKPTQHLESRSSGNYKYNTIVETVDGKSRVVAVVHNGEVYPKFSENKNGVFIANGKPEGKYNYTTGEWGPDKKTSTTGVKLNYGSGTKTANIKELSFGTDKTDLKAAPKPKPKKK